MKLLEQIIKTGCAALEAERDTINGTAQNKFYGEMFELLLALEDAFPDAVLQRDWTKEDGLNEE